MLARLAASPSFAAARKGSARATLSVRHRFVGSPRSFRASARAAAEGGSSSGGSGGGGGVFSGVKSSASSILGKLASFCVGFTVASGACYFWGLDELRGINKPVMDTLRKLEKEVLNENARLKVRVDRLEKQVSALKGK